MPTLCDWCYNSKWVQTRVRKKLTENCVAHEVGYKSKSHKEFCRHFKPHEAVIEDILRGEGCGVTFWLYYKELHFKIRNKFRKVINKKEK